VRPNLVRVESLWQDKPVSAGRPSTESCVGHAPDQCRYSKWIKTIEGLLHHPTPLIPPKAKTIEFGVAVT
jgi:hypothetical protein